MTGSNPSNVVRAGDAFVGAFKREPRNASDAAWLNGYVAALNRIAVETIEGIPADSPVFQGELRAWIEKQAADYRISLFKRIEEWGAKTFSGPPINPSGWGFTKEEEKAWVEGAAQETTAGTGTQDDPHRWVPSPATPSEDGVIYIEDAPGSHAEKTEAAHQHRWVLPTPPIIASNHFCGDCGFFPGPPVRRSPEKATVINQCDGCRRGLPVENGMHRGPGGFWAGDSQSCTAHLYLPEKASDNSWCGNEHSGRTCRLLKGHEGAHSYWSMGAQVSWYSEKAPALQPPLVKHTAECLWPRGHIECTCGATYKAGEPPLVMSCGLCLETISLPVTNGQARLSDAAGWEFNGESGLNWRCPKCSAGNGGA